MKQLLCTLLSLSLFGGMLYASQPQRDPATENLFAALKTLSHSGYTMIGMANALTITYGENMKTEHSDITSSDIREVTGDNPAFVESDLMWYSNKQFMTLDMQAMRLAHARGAVLGYCWHLGGMRSGTFYTKEEGAADRDLAQKIVASPDRKRNPELDWYLTQLDTLAIPVFRELGFPLVFRPLHEMTGDWFWWGSGAGRETYVKLFRLTVDYLREKGIRNLLYCWSPDKDADFGYYPGDDYVDIIGYDAYEPGLMPYITPECLTRELGKLVDYADRHDKVAAWTEVGLRTQPGSEKLSYPTLIPDFLTKYVWAAVKDQPSTSRLAWIMTWYNADWKRDGSGSSFVPYPGMNKEGSAEALADFQTLYHYNTSLFEGGMPPVYASAEDCSIFVHPHRATLHPGEQLTLLGGYRSDWYRTREARWHSSDTQVLDIDPTTGLAKARKPGTAIVTVSREGKTASAHVTVIQ